MSVPRPRWGVAASTCTSGCSPRDQPPSPNSSSPDTSAPSEHLILGRRMADLGIGPWGEEPTFHAPCFVVTHRPAPTIVKKGGTSYIFVTDGIEAALERARQAAGSQDVQVNGGADIARQFLNAGL